MTSLTQDMRPTSSGEKKSGIQTIQIVQNVGEGGPCNKKDYG